MVDEPDVNELAHRVVEQATGAGGPECPKCGKPMEKRQEHRTQGRFGSDRPDVRTTSTYYVCPEGHVVRTP